MVYHTESLYHIKGGVIQNFGLFWDGKNKWRHNIILGKLLHEVNYFLPTFTCFKILENHMK